MQLSVMSKISLQSDKIRYLSNKSLVFCVGLIFSFLFLAIFSEASSACQLGTRRRIYGGQIRASAPGTASSSRVFWGRGELLAPTGYAIIDWGYTHEGWLDEFSYKWTGDGGSYISESQARQLFETAIDAAGRAGADSAEGHFRQELSSLMSTLSRIESNRGSLELSAGVRPGSGFDFNDYWVVVQPWADVECVGTPTQVEQRIEQQLQSVYRDYGREIYFRNSCRYPVRLSLRYREPSGEWITKGWYNFSGNQGNYLSSEGQRIRSNNSAFYYYAEITQEPHTDYSWSGDEDRAFQSRTLPMRETSLSPNSDGVYTLSIQCNNL